MALATEADKEGSFFRSGTVEELIVVLASATAM